MEEPNKLFDPFMFEVQPLLVSKFLCFSISWVSIREINSLIWFQSLKSPYVTDYEWESMQLKSSDMAPPPSEKSEKLKILLSNIDSKPFDENSDDWVTTVENIIPILEVGLIHIDESTGTYC